jgi:hypothetical protein
MARLLRASDWVSVGYRCAKNLERNRWEKLAAARNVFRLRLGLRP